MSRTIPYTDAEIATTVEKEGSERRAAQYLNLHPLTVSRAVVRHRAGLPRPNHRPSGATDEQIVAAYRRLKSGLKVQAELSVSDKTIYQVLAKHGIETTGLAEYRKRIRVFDAPTRAKIKRKWLAGVPPTHIAKGFGRSVAAVMKVLDDYGLEPHNKPRFSETEKRRAKSLYESGLPFKKVAEALGRHENTIIRIIHSQHPESVRSRYKCGPENTNYKGGRVVHHGYVYVRGPVEDLYSTMVEASGYVPEHRLKMARALGRPLTSHETVHHINADRTDNRLENLQLRNGRHGKGVAMVCLDCGSHNIGTSTLKKD